MRLPPTDGWRYNNGRPNGDANGYWTPCTYETTTTTDPDAYLMIPNVTYPLNVNDQTSLQHVYRSQGIEITVTRGRKYGFYIMTNIDGNTWPRNESFTLYSEKEFNPLEKEYVGGVETGEMKIYPHACTFINPITHRQYFAFEDWVNNYNDNMCDLNDLVFMIDNAITYNDDEEVKWDTFDWLIVAEDLGSTDDFDFNDVIIGVNVLTADCDDGTIRKRVEFKALCAGGTMPTYLHFENDYLNSPYAVGNFNRSTKVLYPGQVSDHGYETLIRDDRREFHKWFSNGEIESGSCINTGRGPGGMVGISSTVYLDRSFTLSQLGDIEANASAGFYITVNDENPLATGTNENPDVNYYLNTNTDILTMPRKGMAPQMFIIPDIGRDDNGYDSYWRWPRERVGINLAYPRFLLWAADRNSNTDWYLDKPNSSYVYPR